MTALPSRLNWVRLSVPVVTPGVMASTAERSRAGAMAEASSSDTVKLEDVLVPSTTGTPAFKQGIRQTANTTTRPFLARLTISPFTDRLISSQAAGWVAGHESADAEGAECSGLS